MKPIRTIAITGHRPRALPHDADRHIRAGVREVVDQYPGVTWLVGGAIGADQIATDELLTLGERVVLVLPFAPLVQSARWSQHQKGTYLGHLLQVAEVQVLRRHYDPAGYRERNQWMVKRADLLLAFWNQKPGSGTAATVRLAMARRLPVIVVPMD